MRRLATAFERHADYIKRETLALELKPGREDGFDGELDSVDPGDRNLAGPAVASEGFDGSQRHIVIGRPDAANLVAELSEPRIGLLQSLCGLPIGDLQV